MAIKEFYENLQPCAIQLGNILNRCERVALLRKDLWVLIKRRSLIGVDSRLCVSGNGLVWWEVVFWENGKYFFRKTDSFRQNCKISSFLHRNAFRMNLKKFYLSALLWCAPKQWFCTKLSTSPHPVCVMPSHGFAPTFPLSHTNFPFQPQQYNVQFPF